MERVSENLKIFYSRKWKIKDLNKDKDKKSNGRHYTSLSSRNYLMLAFTQLKVLTTLQIGVRTIVSITECSLSDFDWICLDIFPSYMLHIRQDTPTLPLDMAFFGAAPLP